MRLEIRPFGRNLVIGYVGGRFAAELEAAGPDAMAAFATEQLVEVFGAAVRRQIRRVATTAWVGDPDIMGGYSCALARQGGTSGRCSPSRSRTACFSPARRARWTPSAPCTARPRAARPRRTRPRAP